MHASNKPRSMGKSLLSTCMICSMSVQNGSQQTAKEATTVPAILVNSTNLQAREKLTSGKRNQTAENKNQFDIYCINLFFRRDTELNVMNLNNSCWYQR